MSETTITPAVPEEPIQEESPESSLTAAEEIADSPENPEDTPEEEIPEPSLKERVQDFWKTRALPFLERCGCPDFLLLRFLAVFMILSGYNIFLLKEDAHQPVAVWKEFVGALNFGKWAVLIALGFVLLSALQYYLPKKIRVADHIALFSGTIYFSVALLWKLNDVYLAMSVGAVALVFAMYLVSKLSRKQFESLPDLAAGGIVFATAAAVTIFVSLTTVAQHRVFGTSTFDFGIFVQMFHSMATDFTANTTCERDYLLSHFNVHASYIYYLFAPFYALFPNENTLLIGQAVFAMGGIIPLFLMARKHGYKGFGLVAICMIYVFCTGVLGPCYYSFHENAFLPTLLMWVLYAMDQRKYILFYVMAFLVCIVKEDAPLYILCIALYFFFEEKSWKRFHGLIMTAAAGIYFVLIMDWLVKNGDGQMMTSSRFGHLMVTPEDGFGGLVKNVLMNPAYFFSLFIQEDTLTFVMQMLVPMLFLPFATSKIRRFLLMVPFIIMNLIIGSDYHYAADMGYQYVFGPSCLLIYMLMINCDDMEHNRRNTLVTGASVMTLVMCISFLSVEVGAWESYKLRKDYYQEIEDTLDTIPENGSVAVNTWLLPHVADRKEVYTLDNSDFEINAADESFVRIKEKERYDFFVLRTQMDYYAEVSAELQAAGYTVYNTMDDYMVIYVSPHFVAE